MSIPNRGGQPKAWIPVTDRFEICRDTHCWNLREVKERLHKDGKPRLSYTVTYHANLHQMADQITKMMARGIPTLGELIRAYDTLSLRLERYMGVLVKEEGNESS